MLIRIIPTSFIAVATLALLAACEPADQKSGQEAAPAGGDAATEAAPETTPTEDQAAEHNAMAGRLPEAFRDVPALPPRKSHWTMRHPDCESGPVPAHHRQLFPDGTGLSFVETKDGIKIVNRSGLPKLWTNVTFEARSDDPLEMDLDDCADGATILAHVLSEGSEHLHAAVDLAGEDGNEHLHKVFVVARGVSEDPASRGEIFFVVVDAAAADDKADDRDHVGTAHGAH